ncbi:ComF family protein [Haliea sp. E17]|uniref:ComF family protein n=1 Tax=Haliea sp. E17 TaxID=3401576 RepID=UPI003AAB36DF
MKVDSLWPQLLNGLFPPRCCLCQWASGNDLPLCRDCRSELAANTLACQRCALPLPRPGICGRCQREPPAFDRVIAPWLYSDCFAHLIHLWKFSGRDDLTPLLAQLWLDGAREPGDIDLVVPVPLHWRRLWQRGYNQSQLLADRLVCKLPATRVHPRLLVRRRATAPQSGMDARARAHNLRGAFTVRLPCDNLRIAVVDDVLTTGATAREAARTLKSAGARHVELWCLARTPAPGH